VSRSKRSRPARKRVGRVSYYQHHGAWHIYYREGERQVRRRVAETEADAARVAAQVNAQLHAVAPTLLAFTPVDIPELRRRFLDHHEHVQRSSLATINRYRAATQYLEDFAASSTAAGDFERTSRPPLKLGLGRRAGSDPRPERRGDGDITH
jgi:integrase